MTNLSLVDSDRLQKDPRKLAFLYPKMSVGHFKNQVDEYYRLITIKAAEEAAKAANSLLLPSGCLNHRRRDPKRRLMIFGKNYYVIPLDDVTDLEIAKYKLVCAVEGAAAL